MYYKYANISIGILFLFITSCFNRSANTETLVRDFISEQEEEVKRYQTEYNILYWDYVQSISDADSLRNVCRMIHQKQGLNLELQAGIGQLFSDFSEYYFLKRVKKSGIIHDAILNRQVDVLLRNYEEIKNEHSMVVESKVLVDEKLIELSHQPDSQWRRNDSLFNDYRIDLKLLHTNLIHYLKQANHFSNQLGFKNYFEYILASNELDGEGFDLILSEIDKLTKYDYYRLKTKVEKQLCDSLGVKPEELKLKHYYYMMQQLSYTQHWNRPLSLAEIKKQSVLTYKKYGFNIYELIDSLKVYEGRTCKTLMLNCDNYYDLRGYCYIPFTEKGKQKCIEETASWVLDSQVDESVPYFMRQHHPIIEKSFTSFFANQTFMSEELENRKDRLKITYGVINPSMLFKIRYSLLLANMEREMYVDPEQDLTALFWRSVSEYLLVEIKEDQRHVEWMNDKQILALDGSACFELYAQVLAAQYYYADKNYEGFKVSFSDDFLAYGNAVAWERLVLRLTGETINPQYINHIYKES